MAGFEKIMRWMRALNEGVNELRETYEYNHVYRNEQAELCFLSLHVSRHNENERTMKHNISINFMLAEAGILFLL